MYSNIIRLRLLQFPVFCRLQSKVGVCSKIDRVVSWILRYNSRPQYVLCSKSWLKLIGRREDGKCDCREIQNAAHLLHCPLVGDGKGRTREECFNGSEWCKMVADFLN